MCKKSAFYNLSTHFSIKPEPRQACWHFGTHLINVFNIWGQKSGIHLPPMWRFLLRPNHLAETRLGSIQNQPHSVIEHTQQCLIYTGMQTNSHITRAKRPGRHTRFITDSVSQESDEFYSKTSCNVSVFTSLELSFCSNSQPLSLTKHHEHQNHNQSLNKVQSNWISDEFWCWAVKSVKTASKGRVYCVSNSS